MPAVDVLIPTYQRPTALAVTRAALVGQPHPDLRVVVSDRTEVDAGAPAPKVQAVVRVLQQHGRRFEVQPTPATAERG